MVEVELMAEPTVVQYTWSSSSCPSLVNSIVIYSVGSRTWSEYYLQQILYIGKLVLRLTNINDYINSKQRNITVTSIR